MNARQEVNTPGFDFKRLGMALLLIAGATLLYLAQSATWINNTVFNQAFFTRTIQETIRTEENRNAVATSIVDTTLAERPVLRQAIGDRLIPITSGLLASDISNQIIDGVSNRAFVYATTPDRKDITLNLVPIKTTAQSINTAVARVSNAESPDGSNLPDEIVLLKKTALPDISGTYITMLWVEPLLWTGALGSFALYLYLMRRKFSKGFYNAGITVASIAIIGLLVGGYLPPPVAAMVPNITLRPVIESIIVAFVSPFYGQMWTMLIVSLVAMGVYSQRNLIVRISRNVAQKLNQKLAQVK